MGTAVGAPALDIDGIARPFGSGFDMGAQEFKDSDGDGIPDNVETTVGLNPNDPSDTALDKDGDSISNLNEYQLGTNINAIDSDGDGIADNIEVALGYNPNYPTRIVYVNSASGNDENDGLTTAQAKNTLKAAIEESQLTKVENVIMVAPGTYVGADNKNLDFVGYDIKLRSMNGAAETTIDLQYGPY